MGLDGRTTAKGGLLSGGQVYPQHLAVFPTGHWFKIMCIWYGAGKINSFLHLADVSLHHLNRTSAPDTHSPTRCGGNVLPAHQSDLTVKSVFSGFALL